MCNEKKVKETTPIEYYETINKVNELCVVIKQLVSHMRLNEVVETKDIQQCKTRYGRMYLKYLKEHEHPTYFKLLAEGKLNEHVLDR